MGRTIIAPRQAPSRAPSPSASPSLVPKKPASASPATDNYTSQIVKLIPVDVVGVYLGISTLIAGQGEQTATLKMVQLIVFTVTSIITPFYLKKVGGIGDKTQIIVATVSFFIWGLSLGGPVEAIVHSDKIGGLSIKFLGGIVLMIYTLIVPMFYKAVPKNE